MKLAEDVLLLFFQIFVLLGIGQMPLLFRGGFSLLYSLDSSLFLFAVSRDLCLQFLDKVFPFFDVFLKVSDGVPASQYFALGFELHSADFDWFLELFVFVTGNPASPFHCSEGLLSTKYVARLQPTIVKMSALLAVLGS